MRDSLGFRPFSFEKNVKKSKTDVTFDWFVQNIVINKSEGNNESMLKIILCEENVWEQERWKQMLLHLLFDREDYELRCVADEAELLSFLETEESVDLIFMDVWKEESNRLRLEALVREKQMEAKIIFVTERSEYVFQGYALHAYDYLLKPLTMEMLEKVLCRYLTERDCSDRTFLVVNKRTKNVRIVLKQVSYFVSDRRKIRAVFENGSEYIEFYMKMDELETYVSLGSFVRCHQSFLVNIQKIQSWSGSELCLAGQEKIPISRRYRKTVKEILARSCLPKVEESELKY